MFSGNKMYQLYILMLLYHIKPNVLKLSKIDSIVPKRNDDFQLAPYNVQLINLSKSAFECLVGVTCSSCMGLLSTLFAGEIGSLLCSAIDFGFRMSCRSHVLFGAWDP